MTDKREAILQRLVEIAAGLSGVVTAVRNQDEVSEHARPAIVVFDADEVADEGAVQRGHAGAAPNIVEMTPEVMILLGALPEQVGSALNELRARLIKAVLTDVELDALTGSNGRTRYGGCSTHLRHGRTIEGLMAVQFAFAYVLRLADL